MNPFPKNLGEILDRFETVLVPEMNLGQLAFLLRGRYLVNARSLTKVQGKPFKSSEIADAVREIGGNDMTHDRSCATHQERLRLRPGSALVPRLRRLLDPGRSAERAATLGIPREKYAFISGIGCSSRFPYYMNTYGFHTIHGRAPAVATGLKVARPELSVWVITGDGDALSIGGNHFIHLLRRNVDSRSCCSTIASTASPKGSTRPLRKSASARSLRPTEPWASPFNPLALALGAGATFVARTVDVYPQHLKEIAGRAAQHKGTAFVEIYQNCNIFNDGAFKSITESEIRNDAQVEMPTASRWCSGRIGTAEFACGRFTRSGPGRRRRIDFESFLCTTKPRENPSLAFQFAQLEHPDSADSDRGFPRRGEAHVRSGDERSNRAADRREGARGTWTRILNEGDVWDV